ncbi:MAG: 16S rRNA (cytosine(1402)-N(4))-methyltransferase RsmH [Bifidobacteriaceae bacterium]|jgi:16S rRNA (cytosine1402-N4)-methyltransferase|nr:16S rRNA (cytosine(1402)-N(4))-methyltransferase RsmH [Bifidobacteriaceae bacterium]
MIQELSGHTPVAAARFLELVTPALQRPGALYLDATVGLGGHSFAVAERFPEARIIGLDRDPEAVERARARLGDRAEIFHAPFTELGRILDGIGRSAADPTSGPEAPDAILFDLGVSSMQLDQDRRGFAYSRDTALDMRMDGGQELTAAQILATYSREELTRVFKSYGEERYAWRIAGRVVAARQQAPLERSGQLVDLIKQSVPAASRRTGGNPAKRVFQALRVEVNRELDQLEVALPQAVQRLRVGGRLVVMSYQSLEDTMVKRILTAAATSSAPPGLPVEPESTKPVLKLLTRGAEPASELEQTENRRSAPLRLRAAQKIRATS